MQNRTIEDTEDHITADGLSNSATKLIHPGAVLLVMRSGILRHSIPVAINRITVALNQDMRALIPHHNVEARYLAWLIEGHQQELLNVWSKVGSTVESLESDLIGETEIAVPLLNQQIAIADYLDRETSHIDALIAAKENLLALLAEKRRALITRAVTRGLDTDVSMRDSGVPWLGEVPAHWEIKALRFLVSITSGATPDTGKPEFWDGDIPWVSPKDMKQNEIADAEDHISELALNSSTLKIIEPHSVLIVVRGMILAHSFPCAVTTAKITINQDMKSLRCCELLNPHFLCNYFKGVEKHVVSLADTSAHGTKKIESEVFGRLEICFPMLEEQAMIVEKINSSLQSLDALVKKTEETITLLKERRSVLIFVAVTGRIDRFNN